MIPLLIAGAVVGLGAHVSASMDNSEAQEKNQEANRIIEDSTRLAKKAKADCQKSIDELAAEKTRVLQGNMRRFVRSFSKIKPVNFNETGDLFEIAKFNKNELMTIQSMVNSVQKVSVNDVVGGASGTALAIGAADMIAGGSILGGAGISVGSLAGGAALGAVAAPIFAITGIFSASEASANLEKAKSNLSKAWAYQDECETYSYFAKSVGDRCDLFQVTLNQVDVNWFVQAVDQLEDLVNSKRSVGNFFRNVSGKRIYDRQEMAFVASVAGLAKMVKTIIDTNILDNEGALTNESEQVIQSIEGKLQSGVPLYNPLALPEPQQRVQTQSRQQPTVQRTSAQSVTQTASQQTVLQKSTPQAKDAYKPGIVAKFILWAGTVFWCLMGALVIFAGSFISGTIWIASGLILCPKVNATMKFWPRILISLVLAFVSIIFI